MAVNNAEGEETGGNDAFDAVAPDTAQAEAADPIDTDMKADASQDDPAGQQDTDNRFDYSAADGPLGRQNAQSGDQDWDMIASTIAERPPSLRACWAPDRRHGDEPKQRMIAHILTAPCYQAAGWANRSTTLPKKMTCHATMLCEFCSHAEF